MYNCIASPFVSSDTLQTDGSAPVSASVVLESTSKDLADLQLLDSILNKAQRIREVSSVCILTRQCALSLQTRVRIFPNQRK